MRSFNGSNLLNNANVVGVSGVGSGTVTSVSVATANGFSGVVANATTTPAITLRTSVTGLLKGNGTAISAAAAGTDYIAALSEGANITLTPIPGGYQISSTGGGSPVGPNGAIQYYKDGLLAGDPRFNFDESDATLRLKSNDSSRTATLSVSNLNRLTIGGVDEIDVGGFRSNSYVTCADVYLTNGSGGEVHTSLSALNVWNFNQTGGSDAFANFQMPLTAATTITASDISGNTVVLDSAGCEVYMNTASWDYGMLLDEGSGDVIFHGSINSYVFQSADVVIDDTLFAHAARFDGNVQFYFEGIFYNPDGSTSTHVSNTGVTGVNELSFYFATAYKFDARVYTPAIWDDTYGLAFDVVNRQFFAYDGTKVAQLNGGVAPGVLVYQGLYFPNVDETATTYITNPGSLSVNSLQFRGADDYDFDNKIIAPAMYENTGGTIVFDLVMRDWFDSLGATQIQVVDGFVKLPTLAAGTQTVLVGADVDNQLVSVSLSDFAPAKIVTTISTTDATPTTIATIAIPDDTSEVLTGTFLGRRTGGLAGSDGDTIGGTWRATVTNVEGTVTVVGTSEDFSSSQTSIPGTAWDITFSGSSGNLVAQVIGATNNDVDWELIRN